METYYKPVFKNDVLYSGFLYNDQPRAWVVIMTGFKFNVGHTMLHASQPTGMDVAGIKH